MSSWNDRVRSSVEGYPVRREMQIAAGEVSAATTISINTSAAVHTVHVHAHMGDATLAFPASSGGATLHIHNGDQFTTDFGGLLSGGDFVLDGGGAHYLIGYVLPP